MRQLPLAIGPQPAWGFEAVVAGRNAAALAHLRECVAAPPAGAVALLPTYLWGPAGAGKTRLLQGAVDAVSRRGGAVGWFDAGQPAPWSVASPIALLVFDACERYDAAQQQAAFALFIESQAQGLPLLAAGRCPPVDLPLREDLRTRLGWGHVFAVAALDEAEIRVALRSEAQRRGMVLGDDVLDYLLTRFSRDAGHLLGLLDRLDEFALSRQRAVTVPLLRQLFEEEGQSL